MKANALKSPGLYLSGLETDSLPPNLSAVTGFVGVALRGPLNQPQPIKSWGEFVEIFGELVPYSYLAPSVFGFFLNGGELCIIVRAADTVNRSTKEEIGQCEKINPLQKASTRLNITAADQDAAIKIEAINEGSWGNQIEVETRVKTGGKTRFTFIYKDRREIFDNLSLTPGDTDYFVDVINGDPGLTDYVQRDKNGLSILVNVEHVTDGSIGAGISIGDEITKFNLDGGGDGFINAVGRLNDKDGNPCLTIVSKIKGKSGSNISVGAEPFTTKTALRIANDAKNRLIVENIKHFFDESQEAFDGTLSGETLTISSETVPGEDVVIISAEKEEHALTLAGNVTGNFPVGSRVSVKKRFNIIVTPGENQEPPEIFYNLSMNPNSSRYFENMINHKSTYICVHHVEGGASPGLPVGEIQLAGGKDPGEIDYRYYTGYEDDGKYFDPSGDTTLLGLAALENIPLVTLVAVPDLNSVTGETFRLAQRHILSHCCKMGDRFAILDSRMDGNTYKAPDFPAKEAKFGALYYPWLYCTFEGEKILVPPSGFTAGIIAGTDRSYGINKAPANVKLKGIVDIETLIDRAVQDDLNPVGINCIRKFEQGAIKIWGARTLSKDPKWRYINVRRVFLYILKLLSEELLWAVFEPNHPRLWKRIEATITTFLDTMVAKGMTAGTNSGEAFYVRCNQETNPTEVAGAGQVVAEVGVALAAPAEFIAVAVKKTPEGISVIEEEV